MHPRLTEYLRFTYKLITKYQDVLPVEQRTVWHRKLKLGLQLQNSYKALELLNEVSDGLNTYIDKNPDLFINLQLNKHDMCVAKDSIQDNIFTPTNIDTLSSDEHRQIDTIDILLKLECNQILDLGCGEANLILKLIRYPFKKIVGMDSSFTMLSVAKEKLLKVPFINTDIVELQQANFFSCADDKLTDFDAIILLEVIEHLELPSLDKLMNKIFIQAQPRVVIVTTPNFEYNVLKNLAKKYRHPDHKFEWTRQEFTDWANNLANKSNYSTTFVPIGEVHPKFGPPGQMIYFQKQR